MPPSKRKHQSTVTLHDFFNRGDRPVQSPKDKKTTVSILKRRTDILPDNVIVIDSDSDSSEPEVVQVIDTKKQRLYGAKSFGDVELVSTIPNAPTIHDSGHLKPLPVAALPNSNAARENSRKTQTHQHYFGAPTLLLNGSITTTTAPIVCQSTANTPTFGQPTLLLENIDSPSLEVEQSCPLRSPASLDCSLLNEEELEVDLDRQTRLLDDWETGDDELAPIQIFDEEEQRHHASSPDTATNSPRESSHSTRCPSCGVLLKDFSHLELVKHVNSCLDSEPLEPTYTESKGNPSKDTPRQPTSYHILNTPRESAGFVDCDEKIRPSPNGNAFSALMASHKDNEAWKEASIAEKRDNHSKKGERRKAPFYKVLQGMPIAVDAFRYGTIPGIKAYFLTHAHSDHYTNLASNWRSGPIYCSEGTANLIIHMLSVDKKWVHPLPYDAPTLIPDTGGVRVTLIEANHCPGSSLFFFEGPQTVSAGDSAFKSPFVGSTKTFRYLHCGDFRASPRHVLHPAVKGKKIDHVYLDTTYLDPKYTFPPQQLVISACAELSRRLVSGEPIVETTSAMDMWMTSADKTSRQKREKKENVLIVVGTYSIGKEKIVKAIAHALKTKVYCDARKTAYLRCQADTELDSLLTSDPLEGHVHLLPLGMIATDKLKIYAERFHGFFTRIIGFRPTGWTYTPPTGSDLMPSVLSIIAKPHQGFTYASLRSTRNSTPSFQLFPVPYSEHSSFFELTCFAMSFSWGKMIATVNVGSEASRAKMAKWVARWEAERKRRQKDDIIPYRDIEFW